jgi:hypothetical protein
MNFYILENLIAGENEYDITLEIVVRATNEMDARYLAKQVSSYPDWENPIETSCKLLDSDGPAEVILTDYRAG